MGKVRSPLDRHPLDLAGNLGKEGPHGHILSFVVAPINEQGRGGDLVQVRNDGPVAERTRDA